MKHSYVGDFSCIRHEEVNQIRVRQVTAGLYSNRSYRAPAKP
jgi:hypothetical protein